MRFASLMFASLLLAGCGERGDNREVAAANAVQSDEAHSSVSVSNPSLDAHATNAVSTDVSPAESILASSTPAAGSIVAGPVGHLVFHFSPPARLNEVTVSGRHGTMPMMVTATGEAEEYSLPLSGLDAGKYTVAWRASVGGVDYRGNFGFEVK